MEYSITLKPDEALKKIKDGNTRFFTGKSRLTSGIDIVHLQKIVSGQSPYASILTCSDSRVPPEHIFDANFGELFICRNAGNIIDEVTLGSIEFAATHTGCPLLIIMGHENCGACATAIAHYKNPNLHETHNVDDIVRRIMPSIYATNLLQTKKLLPEK